MPALRPRLLLLTVFITALTAASAAFAYGGSAAVTHPSGQHVDCRDFGFSTGGVFSNSGFNGQYSTDHSGVPQSATVTISNYQAGQGPVVATFNWSSTTPIAQVYVQAGAQSNPQNLYTYAPTGTSDAGLESTKPSISHILFCFSSVPTAVTVQAFTASHSSRGTALRWRTGAEAGTLGFNVYREQGGRRVRLNSGLIMASAGTAGGKYSWVDRAGARPGGRFWLERVSTAGARSWAASAATL